MDAPLEKRFAVRERALRHTVLKAVSALSVTVVALLLFLLMPLFPRELMVLAAAGLGVLAYKAPTPALLLLVLLALPGYVYQIGSALPVGAHIPAPMIVVLSGLLLVTAAFAGEMGGVLGMTTGATAAILMVTPLEFLALPMMIGLVLFRTRHAQVGAVCAIMTFVILYYPILALGAGVETGSAVPIFNAVLFHPVPPASVLSPPEILAKLGQVVSATDTRGALPYLGRLAEYWPLSFEQRLFPVGLLFAILAGAAMATGSAMLVLHRWLEKREMLRGYLVNAAPVSCLLAGTLAFVSLAGLLARPLDYVAVLNIPALLVAAALVGSSGTIANLWLSRRDLLLNLHERLAGCVSAVRTQTDFLLDRTRQTRTQCQRMDTSAEEALIKMCEQELAFTEQTVAEISLADLQQRRALFETLQGKLDMTVQDSTARLYQYYGEDRDRYNEYLRLSQGYGFSLGECAQGPTIPQLTGMGYEDALKLQTGLNGQYETAARSLAGHMHQLEGQLCSEVDPEFKRTGIHIARDYLAQERYPEALQEFLMELSDIEYVLLATVENLDKEILSVLDHLKVIVVNVLMPTATNLGDETNINRYRETLYRIGKLQDLPVGNRRLPDLMRTVASMSELGGIISTLSSGLNERITTLEEGIQHKTPHGYSWGVETEDRARLGQIPGIIRTPPRLVGVKDRMSFLKSTPSAVEAAARVVKEYSIAHELLINYPNVEYLIEETLRAEGEVGGGDLPVKRKYARCYLELYRLKHPGEFSFDNDTARLSRLSETKVPSETRG